MKNPLSFLSRKNLETSLGLLQSRFPVPALIVLVLVGFLFYLINSETESVSILRIVLTLVTTFFFSIGVTLFTESYEKKTWWSQIVPIAYGLLFFLSIRHLTEDYMIDSVVFSILHLVGFVSFLFFAPYVGNIFMKREQVVEYSNYFTRVAWTLLMSVIVGGSVLALGAIAISSVTALFDLNTFTQDYHLYENWMIIALSLIAPYYGLTHLPTRKSVEKKSYETNRFFSFLVRYIATPFIGLYFIILYAYSVKVLVNFQDWPKGMISWMVIGFSIFGYLTYIFSKSQEDESHIIRFFRTVFPYLVPAQILMLGYSIYLRIAQYDLTMNRYFVVIFGVWLAIISLYYTISKRKSLTVITSSIALIALLISVGPWSVTTLPMNRQYNRLIVNLTDAGMLANGTISKKEKELTVMQENDIYSEIQYVCEYDHCEKIKSLFSKELVGQEEKYAKTWSENDYNKDKAYTGMSSWEIVNEVTKALGITYRYEGASSDLQSKYISFNLKDAYDESSILPLDTTGYTTLVRVYNKNSQPSPLPKQYVIIDPDTENLTLRGFGADATVSLRAFNDSLRKTYTANTINSTVPLSELTTTVTAGNKQIKVLFQSYGYANPAWKNSDNNNVYLGITGYALVK